jgi:hypothetical protein
MAVVVTTRRSNEICSTGGFAGSAGRDHEAGAAVAVDARIAGRGMGALSGNGGEAQAREDGEEELLHCEGS